MKNICNQFLIALIMQFFVTSAYALMVTTTVEGIVTLDNAGDNPFGLSIADTISLDVTYDDALIVGIGTDEEYNIASNAGWDFTMTLGTYSFSQSDVTDSSWSSLFFNQGDFDGINFYLDPIDIGAYTDLVIEDFDGGRSLFAEHSSALPIYMEANWDFTTAITVPFTAATGPITVSEPSVLLLMLSGLFGLAITKKYRH